MGCGLVQSRSSSSLSLPSVPRTYPYARSAASRLAYVPGSHPHHCVANTHEGASPGMAAWSTLYRSAIPTCSAPGGDVGLLRSSNSARSQAGCASCSIRPGVSGPLAPAASTAATISEEPPRRIPFAMMRASSNWEEVVGTPQSLPHAAEPEDEPRPAPGPVSGGGRAPAVRSRPTGRDLAPAADAGRASNHTAWPRAALTWRRAVRQMATLMPTAEEDAFYDSLALYALHVSRRRRKAVGPGA